jgi:hypothetical protein
MYPFGIEYCVLVIEFFVSFYHFQVVFQSEYIVPPGLGFAYSEIYHLSSKTTHFLNNSEHSF